MAKFRQKVKGLTLTFSDFGSFLRFSKRCKKASLAVTKRFYLDLTFIGRIFLEKMDFEKSPKNGQISQKSKGVS